MQAAVGDKLVYKGRYVGDHDRIGIIREVHGKEGAPPYVVEWLDAPGDHVVFPGPDAHIEHYEHHASHA